MYEKNILPSLNALRVFEVVSRHLNFTDASKELQITQSAVAQHIRSLEQTLDIILFERRPKGLVLTYNGRKYAEQIKSAFYILNEATKNLKPALKKMTISVTPTFASKWLIPRLNNFTQYYPDINLEILATDRLSHFQNDHIDLAVRYGQPPFGAGLVTILLFNDPFVAVASPHINVDINQLESNTLLHDANNLWPMFLDKFRPETRPLVLKNIHFNQTALAIDAAISGQGIALAQHSFIKNELEEGILVQVFENVLIVDMGFYIVFPHRFSEDLALMKVCDWLLSQK